MIVGVGVDIAEVDFWRQAIRDPTTSVIEGTFTPTERRDSESGIAETAQKLATRFAAKEAFIKAIGSARFGQAPVFDRIRPIDVEVVKDAWGRPKLELHGDALRLADMFEVERIWVSMSHEHNFASATVILEKV